MDKIHDAGIINFYIINLLYTKTSQYFKSIILYIIRSFILKIEIENFTEYRIYF